MGLPKEATQSPLVSETNESSLPERPTTIAEFEEIWLGARQHCFNQRDAAYQEFAPILQAYNQKQAELQKELRQALSAYDMEGIGSPFPDGRLHAGRYGAFLRAATAARRPIHADA